MKTANEMTIQRPDAEINSYFLFTH